MLASAVALLAGSVSALLLFSLDHAAQWRATHRWAIWLLPLTGFAVGLVYHLIGKPVNAGNNLLIDEIHASKKTVPLRMMPLVFAVTVISHFWNYRAVSNNRFCHFTIPLQAPLSCINQRFQGASGFLAKSDDGTLTLPLGGDFRLPALDISGLKTAFFGPMNLFIQCGFCRETINEQSLGIGQRYQQYTGDSCAVAGVGPGRRGRAQQYR
ncbi:hypothetical protein [Pseudomonas sp. B8(2017)]|uniref:hypothetical protein n=1 Tax=Pseudomonas sp. B8(2017) TaxID=1981711 RepID=UPI002113DF3F|nr:hypothetical protein [Pseudomonas sp. B8(2017)]